MRLLLAAALVAVARAGAAFSGAQVVSTEADGARSVYGVDADGDGDVDIFCAALLADWIAW